MRRVRRAFAWPTRPARRPSPTPTPSERTRPRRPPPRPHLKNPRETTSGVRPRLKTRRHRPDRNDRRPRNQTGRRFPNRLDAADRDALFTAEDLFDAFPDWSIRNRAWRSRRGGRRAHGSVNYNRESPFAAAFDEASPPTRTRIDRRGRSPGRRRGRGPGEDARVDGATKEAPAPVRVPCRCRPAGRSGCGDVIEVVNRRGGVSADGASRWRAKGKTRRSRRWRATRVHVRARGCYLPRGSPGDRSARRRLVQRGGVRASRVAARAAVTNARRVESASARRMMKTATRRPRRRRS